MERGKDLQTTEQVKQNKMCKSIKYKKESCLLLQTQQSQIPVLPSNQAVSELGVNLPMDSVTHTLLERDAAVTCTGPNLHTNGKAQAGPTQRVRTGNPPVPRDSEKLPPLTSGVK